MISDGSSKQTGSILNSQTQSVTVFFVIFAILGLLSTILNLTHPSLAIAGGVVFILMVALAHRTSRSALRWNKDGIVGRWTGLTHTLPWSSIVRFEYREVGGLGAELKDGKWVRLMPFPRSARNKPEEALGVLNSALETHKAKGTHDKLGG